MKPYICDSAAEWRLGFKAKSCRYFASHVYGIMESDSLQGAQENVVSFVRFPRNGSKYYQTVCVKDLKHACHEMKFLFSSSIAFTLSGK